MSAELRPGAILDQRFTLVRRLGAGATGAVWLAEDSTNGGVVACKVLHPQMGDDLGVVNQLMREAKVLGQLTHPNITRPIELTTEGRFVFLAMEFVDGQPLQEVLSEQVRRGQHFSGLTASRLFGPLCEGVAHAHSKFIVHRDLKPHNVMVVDAPHSPTIKVLDFGLARLLEGSIFDATTLGRAMGSLFYMSPEQTKGEAATVRSDVFSLGAILFELVTLHRTWARDAEGRPLPAFAGPVSGQFNSLTVVFERIAHGPRPSIRTLRPHLPTRLDELIRSALAIEPTDRPPTVQDLCRVALEELTNLKDAPFVPSTHLPGAASELGTGGGPTIVGSSAPSLHPPAPALVADAPATPDSGPLPTAPIAPELLTSTSPGADEASPKTTASPIPQPNASAQSRADSDSFDQPTRAQSEPPAALLDATVTREEPSEAIAFRDGASSEWDEPELPPSVGRRAAMADDDGPTRTIEASPLEPTQNVGEHPTGDFEGPARASIRARDRAAATEPGDLREGRADRDKPFAPVVIPPPLSDRYEVRVKPAAVEMPKAVVERHARPHRTHMLPAFGSSAEDAAGTRPLPKPTPLAQPTTWLGAIGIAGLLGAMFGFFVIGAPARPVGGVVEVVVDDRDPWADLERQLKRMADVPDDANVRSGVRDAILAAAAALPSGPQRDEIERLASVSAASGNPSGLRAAAQLLKQHAQSTTVGQ